MAKQENKRWSKRVTETSNALDLEGECFRATIQAASLVRSNALLIAANEKRPNHFARPCRCLTSISTGRGKSCREAVARDSKQQKKSFALSTASDSKKTVHSSESNHLARWPS
jgi:hypothetical protein